MISTCFIPGLLNLFLYPQQLIGNLQCFTQKLISRVIITPPWNHHDLLRNLSGCIQWWSSWAGYPQPAMIIQGTREWFNMMLCSWRFSRETTIDDDYTAMIHQRSCFGTWTGGRGSPAQQVTIPAFQRTSLATANPWDQHAFAPRLLVQGLDASDDLLSPSDDLIGLPAERQFGFALVHQANARNRGSTGLITLAHGRSQWLGWTGECLTIDPY